MKRKISNQFLVHFGIFFLMTIIATVFAFVMISLASGLISGVLTKNRYSASSIIKANYHEIDSTQVVSNGGGVQIIDKNYKVVFSAGLDTIQKDQFTVQEFTTFLTESKSKPYHYDILYQPEGEFWLIVTFPTSIRLDFQLLYNKEALPRDLTTAGGALGLVLLLYLVILAICSFIYSRVMASNITIPLKKLTEGTRLLREGDYSARVDLKLKNEFAELQDTFNEMADRIEHEMTLRKKSEEDRKRLILDISHDLKNPLASIQGYSELLLQRHESPEVKAIHQNSIKANHLLNDLFELSKLDSPDFNLKLVQTDLCEALRLIVGELIPQLESAQFLYQFDIPETVVFVKLDYHHFRRLINNLIDNAIRYNPKGTKISVSLTINTSVASIIVHDDGVGIPKVLAKDIFNPFVRIDESRNSSTGGSGLGLSIARKIAEGHGGDLVLDEENTVGSSFIISIPII